MTAAAPAGRAGPRTRATELPAGLRRNIAQTIGAALVGSAIGLARTPTLAGA